MKTTKLRDKSILDATAASLDELAKEGTNTITDIDIIVHNLDAILALRAKHVPHAMIYETLKKSGGLTISEKTYKQYLGEAKKMNGLTRPQRKPSAAIPVADNPA
jgi:hypothetical protein